MLDYSLRCIECGKIFEESAATFLLECDEEHKASLLQADYNVLDFNVRQDCEGIFRFRDWLPVRRCLEHSPNTIVFQSDKLSDYFSLSDLHFAFNGYWPERDANMLTGSFKELEAAAVLARIAENEDSVMVLASAGNTGRAFLEYASYYGSLVLVVIPEFALPQMWGSIAKTDNCKLLVLRDADYCDAIELADFIAALPGFFPEGGAKNVARRDGMGTVMLSAANEIGRIPDHYFQAVGSGTGGIAAWEMAWRLTADGRFGQRIPRLQLSQNYPFTIMTDAWNAEQRELEEMPIEEARSKAKAVYAKVLSNRKPPYSISGGLFDALLDSNGLMYNISKEEAVEAGKIFQEIEGIDLEPAAEVALASLSKAIEAGNLDKDDCVLVNLTGGGAERFAQEGRKINFQADLMVDKDELRPEKIAEKIRKLF